MNGRLMLAMGLLLGAELRAGWEDVRAGNGPKEVVAAVGAPLIASRGKGGRFVTWTYDEGGYVMFERGKVIHWRPSRMRG